MCVMRVMRRRHEPRGDAGHDTSEAAQAAPILTWNDDKSTDYFLRIIIFFGIWGSLLKTYYKCQTLRRGEIYLPEVLKMNSRKWIFWVKIFFLRHTEGGSEAHVIFVKHFSRDNQAAASACSLWPQAAWRDRDRDALLGLGSCQQYICSSVHYSSLIRNPDFYCFDY